MPFLIFRLVPYLRVRLRGWRMPLAVATFVFLSSWGAMALFEPVGSDIASPGTYWWYFVVTSATVGYGDVFPVSTGGRLIGIYVIVGGIVTLTLLFTQLATALQSVRGRRTRGVIALDLSDHVVLLGYHAGRTERIVAELTADRRFEVVLCAWDDVGEDPLPDRPDVHFVRGDLTHEDVMRRACVARARTAVIDARDDNETLAVAIAVDHANPRIHLVAAVRDLGRRDTLRYVNDDVQTVQWHMPYLLTEEASDPGITQIYTDLMSSGGHGNTAPCTTSPGGGSRPTGWPPLADHRGDGGQIIPAHQARARPAPTSSSSTNTTVTSTGTTTQRRLNRRRRRGGAALDSGVPRGGRPRRSRRRSASSRAVPRATALSTAFEAEASFRRSSASNRWTDPSRSATAGGGAARGEGPGRAGAGGGGGAPPAATTSSCARTAPAVPRRAGSLSSSTRTVGSSAPARSIGAGCSDTTAKRVAMGSPRSNGGRPSTAA